MAGPVADHIAEFIVALGEFPGPADRRGSGLLSERVRHEVAGGDPEADFQNALYKSRRIVEGLALRPTRGEILAEVRRAERRAQRILTRRWGDVLKLAESLCRRRSGRMTARQVGRLLAR